MRSESFRFGTPVVSEREFQAQAASLRGVADSNFALDRMPQGGGGETDDHEPPI